MVFECKNSFGLKEDVESVIVRVQCPPPTIISCGRGRPAALLPAITVCNQGLFIATRTTLFTFNHNGSGGAVMGGTAEIELDDVHNEEGLGGAEVGGEGDEMYTAFLSGGGIGISANSAADVEATYNPETIHAPIIQQNESYYTAGEFTGTFVGGLLYFPLDIITLTGGTTVVVDAESGLIVTAFTVLTSGPGLGQNATYSQVSTSGSGFGFTLTTDTNNEGLHGSRIGGESENQSHVNEEGSAGAALAGAATLDDVAVEEGSGGIQAAGLGEEQYTGNASGDAGAQVAGLASLNDTATEEGSGGIQAAGDTDVHDVVAEEGSGGIQAAGVSAVNLVYADIKVDPGFNSNVLIAGLAIDLVVNSLSGTAGAHIGGISEEEYTACPACGGGEGFGGSADVQYVANPPTGNVGIDGAGVADESVA